MASCAGTTPTSPMAFSRASTAWSRLPRPRLEATDQPATSRRSSTSSPASSNSAYPPETARSLNIQMQARHALETDLRRALVQQEFEVFYQPLIDIRTRRVCSFEALLRWRHPVRGLVAPDSFIPAAEELGLIGQIGEVVLARACAEATHWPAGIKVAVNLSPAQFADRGIMNLVMGSLQRSGLPPDRLELEITETLLLQESEDVLATLHELQQLGVTISMDDFGTGYSSLSYLRKCPFRKVKSDKSFIRELGN